MIKNGNDFANNQRVRTQVCIVGSGPAGITAAWHLQKAGLQVILIEGSRDYRNGTLDASWPDKVLLYNGKADGLFTTNEPEFLISPFAEQTGNGWERERVFGGTSAHWAGQCRPLDPVTFRERPGFPKWPINRADLDLWYAEAATFCGLYSDNFTAEYWAKILGAEVPHLAGFDTEMYQFVAPQNLNFAQRTYDGITIGESKALVILNASLLEIEHSQGAVVGLRVASMNGDPTSPKPERHFTIQADAYVLACGAVANARQLLLSNAGNEHDQVGRNFMCHPIPAVADVVKIEKDYLTPEQIKLMTGGGWSAPNGVSVTARFSPNADQQFNYGIGSCWFSYDGGGYYYEVAPNRSSRVTLDDTRDPVFGQQQTRITWLLGDRDGTTYHQTTQHFQTAVEKLNGKVSFLPWEKVRSSLFVNGHHIGTTRMSAEPRDGVVDANLKVHSLDNLYVAGSSVFASAGISNPTFTIVTLSIRLAAHLSAMLGKQSA
jgi:choline dehydrogenase-like flavoprotein